MRVVTIAVSGLLAVLVGCVMASDDDVGVLLDTQSGFSGSWSVEWCDASNPALDCGGFSVTLRQVDDLVCGEFAGALVNLRQVDEGDIVGTVDGDGATLQVRSGRNDSVAQVRVTRSGDDLHWKELGTIRQGGTDVSIIASDDILKPAAPSPRPHSETCRKPTKGDGGT